MSSVLLREVMVLCCVGAYQADMGDYRWGYKNA